MNTLELKEIVKILWTDYAHQMSDWEQGFIDNMVYWQYDFTERQQETILKLNKKYRYRIKG
jgi:hypothetical protein